MFLLPMSRIAKSALPKLHRFTISEHYWARKSIIICFFLLVLVFCVFCSHVDTFADTQFGASEVAADTAVAIATVNTTVAAATANTETKVYSDVLPTAWYASDLRFISADPRKILEGYSDGNTVLTEP